MKTIGVATWYKNLNFGGTLQAFAMAFTLNKLGYGTEFIDYQDHNKIKEKIKDFYYFICYPKSARSRNKIRNFIRSNLCESPLFSDLHMLEEYSRKFDAVICGSDQIWQSANGCSPIFFLQFANKEKRIAYAPSIGTCDIDDFYLDDFVKYVKTIPYLSVRETAAAKYIKQVVGADAKVVVDPTLLLTPEEWRGVSAKSESTALRKLPTKYILCYFLGDDERYREMVEHITRKKQIPVFFVSSKCKNYGKKQIECGPDDLLGLIDHAEDILTDSYHGTILSLNLGKKPVVMQRFDDEDRKNQNSRIYSILEQLECMELLCNSVSHLDDLFDFDFNYSRIQLKLEKMRNDSIDYLYQSIQDIAKHTTIDSDKL